MQQIHRKLLVTSALPYANGSLHIGHLLEHIQADIWVRFQKMLGRNCIFISGEDYESIIRVPFKMIEIVD